MDPSIDQHYIYSRTRYWAPVYSYGDALPERAALPEHNNTRPWIERNAAYRGSGFPPEPLYPDDESFLWAAGIWLFFTLLLLAQGFCTFYRSHAVEKRRVSEVLQLVSSSRRPYQKPAPSTKPSSGDAEIDVEDTGHDSDPTTNVDGAGKDDTDTAEVECPMCLEDFVEGEEVSKLPCGHVFHSTCIEKWLLSTTYQQRTCPNCRQTPLVSDQEFEQIELEEAEQRAERTAQANGNNNYANTLHGGGSFPGGGSQYPAHYVGGFGGAIDPSIGMDALAFHQGGFLGIERRNDSADVYDWGWSSTFAFLPRGGGPSHMV